MSYKWKGENRTPCPYRSYVLVGMDREVMDREVSKEAQRLRGSRRAGRVPLRLTSQAKERSPRVCLGAEGNSGCRLACRSAGPSRSLSDPVRL